MIYEELERIAFGNVREGHSVSLPLLVKNEETVAARFLVYSVNQNTEKVGIPFRCFEVDLENKTVSEIDLLSVISEINGVAGFFVAIPNYQHEMDLLPQKYQKALMAMASDTSSDSIHEYASSVLKLTQPCLHPYCKALAPELFS